MNIEFVNELPPRRREAGFKYPQPAVVADMLRKHPNQWARIREYVPSLKSSGYVFTSQCRNGKIKPLAPSVGFEVESRIVGDELHIFARYIGA